MKPAILPPTKSVCGFKFFAGTWAAAPQVVFKPRGLAIWGAPVGALLSQSRIGNRLEADIACNGIPAKFFGLAESYAQLAQLVAEGKEPPAWCDWSVCYPGCIIRLEVTERGGKSLGPDDGLELCMWGEHLQ